MGRVTAKRKRELEKELKEMSERVKEISVEIQESLWIRATVCDNKTVVVSVDRFFEGNCEPAVIERKLNNIRGLLSVRPKKRED